MMNRKPDFPSSSGFLAGGGTMERLIRNGRLVSLASWATHRLAAGAQDRRQPHASGASAGLYRLGPTSRLARPTTASFRSSAPSIQPGWGQPAAVLWAEIWVRLGPINAAVLAGEAQWFEDMPFALAGRDREVSWFSFSYTPYFWTMTTRSPASSVWPRRPPTKCSPSACWSRTRAPDPGCSSRRQVSWRCWKGPQNSSFSARQPRLSPAGWAP